MDEAKANPKTAEAAKDIEKSIKEGDSKKTLNVVTKASLSVLGFLEMASEGRNYESTPETVQENTGAAAVVLGVMAIGITAISMAIQGALLAGGLALAGGAAPAIGTGIAVLGGIGLAITGLQMLGNIAGTAVGVAMVAKSESYHKRMKKAMETAEKVYADAKEAGDITEEASRKATEAYRESIQSAYKEYKEQRRRR